MTRRPMVALVSVLLLVVGACGTATSDSEQIEIDSRSSVTSDTGASDPGTAASPVNNLADELGGTDLLVTVADIEAVDTRFFDVATIDSWQVRVVEVLYIGDVAADQQAEPDVPYVIPEVAPGDVLIIEASRQPHDAAQSHHRLAEASDETLVSINYLPQHRLNPDAYTSGLFLNFAADVTQDGSITFLTAGASQLWDAQLDHVVEELAATRELDLLVEWAVQAEAERRGGAPGEITEAIADFRWTPPSS